MNSYLRTVLNLVILNVVIYSCSEAQLNSRILRLTEESSDGEDTSLNMEKRNHWIDINSNIKVQFNLTELSAVESQALNSPQSQLIKKRAQDAVSLLKRMSENLRQYVETIAGLRASLVLGADSGVEQRFREAMSAHGKLIDETLTFLESNVSQEILERALGSSDETYSAVLKLIEQVLRDLKDESLELMKDDSVFVAVWCIHSPAGRDPVRIHMPNYDDLPSGNVNLIDKVTFKRTEEEEKRLLANQNFHKELISLVKEIGGRKSDMRQAIEDMKVQFLEDLQSVAGLFGTEDISRILEEITVELKNTVASPAIIALREDLNALRSGANGFKDFFELKDLSMKFMRELKTADGNPQGLFDLLNTKKNQLTELSEMLKLKATKERLQQLEQVIARLRTTLIAKSESISVSLKFKIEEFVSKQAPKWLETFNKVDSLLKKYPALRTFAERLITIKDQESIGTKFSEEFKDPGAIPIPLSEVKETSIDLQRTGRKEDDTFTLYVKFTGRDFSSMLPTQNFTVRKFGWYSIWAGSLVFLKPQEEKTYQPATGVSWLLHHRSRIGRGNGILGNIINIGLGVNSVVFSSGGKIEYGLGGTVTLFNNLLQVGYGMNLQRESNRGYFFIGASFFDLLGKTQTE